MRIVRVRVEVRVRVNVPRDREETPAGLGELYEDDYRRVILCIWARDIMHMG